jgi:hypothetical protein
MGNFSVIDVFNGLAAGDAITDGLWTGSNTDIVFGTDPISGAPAMVGGGPQNGGDNSASFDLGSLAIPDGGAGSTNVGTLFFQFSLEDADESGALEGLDIALGLSDTPLGNSFSDQGGYFINNAANLQARNEGGAPNQPTVGTGVVDTLYSVWMVFSDAPGASDTYDVYIEGGAFLTQTLIADDFGMRNDAADGESIDTLHLFNFNDSPDNIYYSNLFIDNTGENLTNPVPEPSAYAAIFGAIALAAGIIRRRLCRG